jgi:hypothetical protein
MLREELRFDDLGIDITQRDADSITDEHETYPGP